MPTTNRWKFKTSSVLFRYGVAVVAVAFALWLTLLLWPLTTQAPFLLFFAAVMISAWCGGLGSGLFAMVLAAAGSAYFLLPPFYSLRIHALEDSLWLGLFVLVAVMMSSLNASRQRAEKAERAQREYFQVTLASIGDGVIVTDPAGTVTFMNAVAEAVTGWTTAEATGKALPDVFHIVNEETRQPVENPVAKVLRTGKVAGLANHTVLIRRDGSECSIDDSAAPIQNEQGNLLGIILVFRDITTRRQAEEVLRESEVKFRMLADLMPGAVWTAPSDGAADYANRYWYEFTGSPADRSAGEIFFDAIHPDDAARATTTWTEAQRTGQPYETEMRLCNQHGEPHWFLVRGVPSRDAGGSISKWVGLSTDITERKQAEETLQRAEERLRYALDAAHMVAWEWDAETEEVTQSPNADRVMGLAPGKLITSRHEFFALVHPDDRDRLFATLHTSLQTQTVYTLEFRLCCPDGVTRWMEDHGRPRLSATGKPRYITGVLVDITVRKQAEEERQQATALLQAVSETTSELIYVKDRQNRLLFGNPGLFRAVGKAPEEILGRSEAEWYQNPTQAAAIFATDRRVMTTGQSETLEEIVTTPAGLRTLLSTKAPYYDAQGAVIGLLGVSTDITARKRAEEALRRSEQELADFFENATVGLHWVSADGIILRVNQAELDLLGYTREEYMGRHIAEFHLDQAVIHDILNRLTQGETLHDYPAQLRCKDGSVRHVLIDSNVLRENGQFVHTRCFTRDITARKEAEAAQAHLMAELQRANEELQQFAYIVSHDLNEPLRTMSSFVTLLARQYQGKLDAEADEYMGFITDAAQRMQRMLTDLLEYTRTSGQALTFAPVDCEALLTRVCTDLQMAITDSNATLTHDSLPTVSGDATRLGQVFQNLIGNALKFRGTESPHLHISAVKEDQHWRFAVRDNGIGIDPEHTKRLFQVFQRLHTRSEYPGTGIGLAICKKIVEQHGGRIWVESQPGAGAIFYFTIQDRL